METLLRYTAWFSEPVEGIPTPLPIVSSMLVLVLLHAHAVVGRNPARHLLELSFQLHPWAEELKQMVVPVIDARQL